MAVCWLLGNGSLISWQCMLNIGDYYSTVFLLDLVTSSNGGIGPYIGLCALSGAFGVADAHVQGGMVGDVSFMLPEFIQSFLAGLAASGVLTSVLRLITKVAFESSNDGLRKGAKFYSTVALCLVQYTVGPENADLVLPPEMTAPNRRGKWVWTHRSCRLPAVLFLSISAFFELLCVIIYAYTFPKLPIVNYYRSKAASEGSKTVKADLAAAGVKVELNSGVEEDPKKFERLSNKELLMQNLDNALDIYLIYVLTLAIFPGFVSEDTGHHRLGSWYVLLLMAMYNIWDLVGRYTPLIKMLRINSRKILMFAVIARFLFIPAFYFTDKYGDQGWMLMLTSVLGLSNGHLTVCVLTAAPKGYKALIRTQAFYQGAMGNVLLALLPMSIAPCDACLNGFHEAGIITNYIAVTEL
ncbi:hypothetical protein ACLOJK_039776 [Asimina triloba]